MRPRRIPANPSPARAAVRPRSWYSAVAGAAMLVACGGGADDGSPVATAQSTSRALASPSGAGCGSATANSLDKLLDCVTLPGVRAHQQRFQAIADAHGGNRAAGTPGYEDSVAYVRETMQAAGYKVTLHPFTFSYTPPALLMQVAPVSAVLETGSFTQSGPGDVTAPVVAVDVVLGLPRDPVTSGCEAADFAGFPAGAIALVQRGTCNFSVKVAHAQAAGAAAVIIFNQGNTSDRMELIVGTLAPLTSTIPVVGASFDDGVRLAQPGTVARVRVEAARDVTQHNVIAESVEGDPNNVVIAGGHLDSVQRGPGINDNGSGSAVLLEVARQMAKVKPRNRLRFAWWGAEEAGLVGSTAYVASLSEAERAKVALYLNFDMVGSPNHVFFIYDGDNSDGVGAGPGPDGSAAIEKVFERFYTLRNLPYKGTDFTGRSDYGPFVAVGIPSGGLFTGAEGVKSAAEAAVWGGTAGIAYDPCYHLACDTFANNNDFALEVNADAVAYATLQFAMSTQEVNAQRGKGNFRTLRVPFPLPPAK